MNILTSKKQSPSLHWLPVTKTGKARSAIRRYWHEKVKKRTKVKIQYYFMISLPDKPGQLGNNSVIGDHNKYF